MDENPYFRPTDLDNIDFLACLLLRSKEKQKDEEVAEVLEDTSDDN